MSIFQIDASTPEGSPDPVVATLQVLLASMCVMVPSVAGVDLTTTTGTGQVVTLRLFDPGVPVASVVCSVELPLAEPSDPAEIMVSYYAAVPDAFADLVADTRGSSVVMVERVLDGSLLPPAVTTVAGLDDVDTINQAVGLLLEAGETPEAAFGALASAAAAANATVVEHARHVVRRADQA